MDNSIKLWKITTRTNPHLWSSGDERLLMVCQNRADAEHFYAIHPQYHYVSGVDTPARIIELSEFETNTVLSYWNPTFP